MNIKRTFFKKHPKIRMAVIHASSVIRYPGIPWNYWNSFVSFPVKGFLRVHKLFGFEKPYDKIETVKNKYVGQRCFIVATGPSLTLHDISLLKNEYTFGVNTIFRLYDKTDWRPNFYTMMHYGTDVEFVAQFGLDASELAKDHVFLEAHAEKSVNNPEKVIFVNVCWLDHWYNYGSTKFKYNPNLLFGVYDFYSITHAAIMIAMYMGFDEICLLGVDNNYFGEKQHANGAQLGGLVKNDQATRAQRMMGMGYEKLKEISERQGVKIVNCTRGGTVECFERCELEKKVSQQK